jgi:diguanylate cyclase (GGDEF)-like protein/PAS domain S-box-containing protein
LAGQLALFAGGFLPCLWIAVAVLSDSAYDDILAEANKENQNLATIFAEEVNSSVDAIDLTLIDLRERWLEEPRLFDLKVRKRQTHLEERVAFQVSIIGADGRLVYSSANPSAGSLDLSDREHFRVHLGGKDRLFVSRPLRGRVSNRPTIQFTRPLPGAGNRFGGVIVLSVAPDYFTRFSEKMHLGTGGSIALLRSDGAMVAREPALPAGSGVILKDMPSFDTIGARPWLYSRTSQVDGVLRLYAMRALPKHPLAVTIGRSREQVLASYSRQRNVLLGGGAGLSLLTVLIGYSLLAGLRDRTTARLALEESEFRWMAALEGGGHGVWDWNIQAGTVYFSRRWRDMLGYHEDEILTLDAWAGLIHPEDRERVFAASASLVAGHTPAYALEYRMRAKDACWRWISARGKAVTCDAQGRATRASGTHLDITERKLRDESLQSAQREDLAEALFRSDQRFRQLADAMPQIVWIATPDGAIDHGNSWVNAYTGLADAIDSENWTALLHPDDVALTLVKWQASVGSGELFETEYRVFRQADRCYRWHQVRAMPIRDEQGAIVKWYGTSTDNHDSRLANEEIRRLAQRLSTTLDSINEAFFTIDPEWRFSYINKETERVLGRERAGMLGRVLWEEYPELVGALAEIEYRRAVEQGCPVEFENYFLPLRRWFKVRAYPSSEGLAVYCRDITAGRRLQLFKDEQMKLLELIAQGAPLAGILELAARIVASSGHDLQCAVMLLREDGAGFGTVVASGVPEAMRERLQELALDRMVPPELNCPPQRGPFIVTSLGADPHWCAVTPQARSEDDHACWCYPIHSDQGSLLGVITVLAPPGRTPDKGDTEILSLCVHTLSIAVTRLRTERKARASEDQLRLRQRAIDASANPIAIRSAAAPEFPVEYVNPAFEQLTGYSLDAVTGKSLVFMPRDDPGQPALAEMQLARLQQREGRGVVRVLCADGTPLWLDNYSAPVFDDAGLVTHFVHAMYDVTESRQYQAELEYQSNYDSLTGLANRNLLCDRVSQAIARAAICGEQAWIVCINLDRFRLVIETMGHAAGNHVLQQTAARLQAALTPVDTAARTGGDEFVLVLTDVSDEHAATSTVQRVMAHLAEPVSIGDREHFLSCTAGLAMIPADGDTADALIKHAHIAMHRAKEAGGGRLQFYTASMNLRALERLRLEGDLRHALQRDELLLHYQPQVDARTGRIVGMEALLRWAHPELGMIAPDRFIPLAEETGMIIPIGTWVLRTACAQARRWHDAGWTNLRVGVNLSGKQFYQPDLLEVIAAALAETGLPANCLDIELTEGLVMTDIEQALAIMNALKGLDVQLSLDDFGTGYSSLSYLKRFPIDVLKIDKAFVRNVTTDPDEAAIVRSIISLARSLQLQVIAEGVETEEQLSYLTRHRCDQIQGYYFSRPVPAAQFEQLLNEDRALPVAHADGQVQTLLLVDDDPNVSAALYRVLRRDGYRVLRAYSGVEGLGLLALHEVQVVISDQRMPGMMGTEFLSRVKQIHPDTIRIMLSGYTAVDSIIEATNSGAVFRFHTKPWDDDALRASIAEAFRYHWLMRKTDDESD